MSDRTPYQAIGGTAACRKLAEAFYARVARDAVLRPLFPGKTLRCAIEEFSAFLVQLLGGPSEDTQYRWWLSLRESHLRFKIGQKERDAWMNNMVQALDEVEIGEPARGALREFFERSSAYVVNRGQAPVPPGDGARRRDDIIHQDLSRRWSAQCALDEAVVAVHRGDGERAIALAQSAPLQAYLEDNHAVCAALLATMIATGESMMLNYVRTKLAAQPYLARERYSGRTLLHGAAAAGSAPMVELLLQLGAAVDVLDTGGHTPLYSAANECESPEGADVVRALIRAGANVNACGGVKHCTPLHMAARRDHVEIAETLLESGADLEARDSLGDTPLRRAVNCGQTAVAALFLSRGADLYSSGSKGLTPVRAARSTAMKRLLAAR